MEHKEVIDGRNGGPHDSWTFVDLGSLYTRTERCASTVEPGSERASALNLGRGASAQVPSSSSDSLRGMDAAGGIGKAAAPARFGNCVWDLSRKRCLCSTEMLDLLGLSGQSTQDAARALINSVHPEDRRRVERILKEAIRQGRDYETRHRVIRADGSVREVQHLGGVIRGASGSAERLVATLIDVTEKVHQEDETQCIRDWLVEAEKLVSLGMLASGIAHEINNPNQTIMSSATFLLESWKAVTPILEKHFAENGDFAIGGYEYSNHSERVPEAMQNVLSSAKRIDVIAQELRGFARRGPDSRMGIISVNAIVKSAVVLVSNLLRKSTERFEVVYGNNLPYVRAHYQRMEQVLINLIQNACQALPDRQKGIQVSTSYDSQKDAVVIVVRDEGIGVEQKHLERISEPFFTTKWESGGCGLGLWISSNIVMQHGGLMQFNSIAGKGSTVSIILPAVHDEQ